MPVDAATPRVDDRDWAALSLGDRIHQLEVEGYLVLPDLLTQQEIADLKALTATWETTPVDYSKSQRGRSGIQFEGGLISELIAHPPTLEFLRELCGDDLIVMSAYYARSEPGHPGISLHTDGQPYGSAIFGYHGSVPLMVGVLYYLDGLPPEVSPFRVVPRSHLSFHADANPYLRLESHPEEVMVPAKAGSAVLINHRVFHGNYPNVGNRAREMLAIAYRPAWAGPQGDVPQWDEAGLKSLPEHVRQLFGDPNTRHWAPHGGNKPESMRSEAPGMDPSRWDRRANRGSCV